MYRSVAGRPECLLIRRDLSDFIFRNCKFLETLPDIFCGLGARMHHILSIKAVIPELVEEDFIGWKIFHALPYYRIYGKKQCGFTQLVSVCAIGKMPDGRNREDYFFSLA